MKSNIIFKTGRKVKTFKFNLQRQNFQFSVVVYGSIEIMIHKCIRAERIFIILLHFEEVINVSPVILLARVEESIKNISRKV